MINIRNRCFETNSSSNHTICISMDSQIDPEIHKLIKDDKLYIYPRNINNKFRELKTNKCLDKLQFLVSLVCSDITTLHGTKQIKQLRSKLKRVFGVSSVYFGAVDEYFIALKGQMETGWKNFDNMYYTRKRFLIDNFKLVNLDIDKNSALDLKEEIFESQETLRSFILSPNSWLFVYSDSDKLTASTYGDFIKEKYTCINNSEGDSIAIVNYTDDLKVEKIINLFSYGGCDVLEDIRDFAGNITLESGELVWKSANSYIVMMDDNKYYLIRAEQQDDLLVSCDALPFFEEDSIKYKTNRVKTPESILNIVKSYKKWPITILSEIGNNIII